MMAVLVLAIGCRSYAGVIIPDLPWYSFLSLGIIATVLGKFLGGYIWEKIGNANMLAFLTIGTML
jgi:hypothetical protein